jgi:hypothetical protein
MNRFSIILVAVIAAHGSALCDDVPFAEPAVKSDASAVTLADIMGATQWRHIKLWYAIKAKNWELSDYELGKLTDTFDRAATLYRYIPVELIVAGVKPITAMREAISTKNNAKLEAGFTELTNACNACHRAAQVGFIVIQTPTFSPLTDQKFSPTQSAR